MPQYIHTHSSIKKMEQIGEYTLQFGTVGASAWLLTKVVAGGNSNCVLADGRTCAEAIALGAGMGAIVADFTHKYVMPHVTKNEKMQTIDSLLLNAGVSAATTVGVVGLMDRDAAMKYWLPISLYAISSEFIRNYVENNFVGPAYKSFWGH